eukprot:g3502.t1
MRMNDVCISALRHSEPEESAAFTVRQGVIESADHLHCFRLDTAFGEETTQDEVYEKVGRPVVEDVLSGYNGTILAYGPTGSGKTFCMFGPHGRGPPEFAGLVPRAVQQVLDFVSKNDGISLECSFYEVYLEKVRDFLSGSLPKNQLKELPSGMEGPTYKKITTASEALQILRLGLKLRVATNTRLNEHSSRSHAIFSLVLRQEDASGIRQRKLTLVDLAGSEKVRQSGSVGGRLEEAKKINFSLSTLGHVIEALADRRPQLGERIGDSRLTRLLEESLGGNCRTTVLVACSPSGIHASETLSSLRFAARAKKIENMVGISLAPTFSANTRLLERRISQLKRELARLEERRDRERSGARRSQSADQRTRRDLAKSASPRATDSWALRGWPAVDKAEHKDIPEALPLPSSSVTLLGSCRSTATGTSSSCSVAAVSLTGSASGTPLSHDRETQREESPCPPSRGGYSFIIEATPLQECHPSKAARPHFQTLNGNTIYFDNALAERCAELAAQLAQERQNHAKELEGAQRPEPPRGRSTASCASRLALSMTGAADCHWASRPSVLLPRDQVRTVPRGTSYSSASPSYSPVRSTTFQPENQRLDEGSLAQYTSLAVSFGFGKCLWRGQDESLRLLQLD